MTGTELESLRKQAEQGDAKAQSDLGDMYFDGRGVQQDYTVAAKWYSLAAEQGDARSKRRLGWMYSYGRGVPQDDKKAMKLYHRAAELGDVTRAK